MTRIQQVLFALDGDYQGHPYYVNGSALVHAIASNDERLSDVPLAASHGVFTPGEYGVYPDENSNGGANPNLGGTLPPVERYEDLFLFRNPSHPWLLDSRPDTAANVHDLRIHGGKPTFTPKTTFATPEGHYHERRTVRWYVHAYLHSPDPTVVPLDVNAFESLAVGGSRNYGYGPLEYVDSQVIDLDDLDYSWLETDGHSIELVTPYVLDTEYPGSGSIEIPWWWGASPETVRTRETRLMERGVPYRLETADHGQLFEYTGSSPISTAKNGITRVGTHSKYGFGELRVTPR